MSDIITPIPNDEIKPQGAPELKPNADTDASTPFDDGLPKASINTKEDKLKKISAYIIIGMFIALFLLKAFWVPAPTQEIKSIPQALKADYNHTQKPGSMIRAGQSAVASGASNVSNTTSVSTQSPTSNDMQILKLQQQLAAQNLKIYRMRQNAPIDLYKGDGMNQSVSSSSSSASMSASSPLPEQSGLPLSNAQIAALRKAQGNNADPNDAFASAAQNTEVVRASATQIPFREDTVTQGTLIAGVLQTAINSDLPGMIKANVSQDVYSNKGDNKLIPKGSTLIGQYSSGISMGQQRVFVMWTRLIRPDGVDVMLGSPGTDSLGTAGLGADVLQTHFWERFGGATMVSIVGGAVATAGVAQSSGYNSSADYRMMMSDNFQQSANATLLSTINRKPTIMIYQGSKIDVFVNRDLSFHDVQVSQ